MLTDRLVDEQRLGRFNLKLLVWSFLAMFADGYDISALSFAAPELVRAWHVPQSAFGPVFSASLFGILFGAPLLGYFGDRFGRRTAIIAGSIVYGVSTLAMLWATNLTTMLVLRIITGIGIGGLMPNTIALNSELSPKRWRATLVVLMFTGITLGSGTPGPVAAWLVPHYGWKILFLIGGVVPLVVAFCLRFALPESIKFLARYPQRRAELLQVARAIRPELTIPDDAEFIVTQQTRGEAGLTQIFGRGLALITPLLWVCFATALMANYFLNSWLPLIFEGSGMSPRDAALASTLYHVGGTVGGFVISILLDRFGFVAIAVLLAIAAPAVAALGLNGISHGLVTFLAAAAGFSVLGAQFGNNASAGLLYPPAFRSEGVGWALGIGRFGSIIGPSVGGVLIAMHLPMQQLFLAASLPLAVGLIAAALLARLCYVRFRGFQIDDTAAVVPVAPGGAQPESLASPRLAD